MSSGGKIDAYLDCSSFVNPVSVLETDGFLDSPYSFFAFTWLKRNKQALADHGVGIE